MPIGELTTRFEYNRISFDVYRSKISSTPIMDEAKRTVKYVTHVITVEAIVYADDPTSNNITEQTTNTDLALIRILISKPGKVLTFFDKGFGNLNVNQNGVFDSKFGPIPKVIEWSPIGDNLAANVVIQIETTIPECDNARYRYGIADLSYSSSTDIDADGYMVRKINGYIEIPMTRLNGGTRFDDHIDRYREMTRPELMTGFQRTSQSFVPSMDKRSATFSYVDVQLVEALPEFCTNFGLTEEYDSNISNGFLNWNFTLSGSITMAAGMPKRSSLRLFLLTLRSRLVNFEGRQILPDGQIGLRKSIFQSIRFSNPIAGRPTNYSATFLLIAVGSIQEFLRKARIWEPIPGTNFQLWKSSMENSAGRVRGSFDYRETEDDEQIIDLCSRPIARDQRPEPPIGDNQQDQPENQVPPAIPPGQEPPGQTPPGGFPDLTGTIIGGPLSPGFGTNPTTAIGGNIGGVQDANLPPEESSWIAYNIAIAYAEDGPGRYARHKPMSDISTVDLTRNVIDVTEPSVEFERSKEGDLPTTRPKTRIENDILQEVATPSVRVYLYGSALRFGYRIPSPNLVKVGKRDAKRNRVLMWDERIVMITNGTPVYNVKFQIEYLLEAVPRGPLPVPANPYLRINGRSS